MVYRSSLRDRQPTLTISFSTALRSRRSREKPLSSEVRAKDGTALLPNWLVTTLILCGLDYNTTSHSVHRSRAWKTRES